MQNFDIFQWANRLEEVKNNVSVELFLFNKNYTPFKVRYSDSLTQSVKSLFLLECINFINTEAEKGLKLVEFEQSQEDDNIIFRTDLEKVGRAETLLHLIENEYKDISYFTETDHDFKKIKGIIAKFAYLGSEEANGGQKVFYIAKNLSPSQAVKGSLSWELKGESFEPLTADLAIKMPDRNEVAIIDQNIIIMNQPKFEKLFEYDLKLQAIAEEKARAIQEKYRLSFSEGLDLNTLLLDKKPLIKKIEHLDLEKEMSQEQLIDYADEMAVDLMADEKGQLIIMDTSDLTKFVNLVNEDYYISPVNGRRYEIKSKKLLDDDQEK